VGVATAFPCQSRFFFATFPERFMSRPRQTTKPFRKDLKNAANVRRGIYPPKTLEQHPPAHGPSPPRPLFSPSPFTHLPLSFPFPFLEVGTLNPFPSPPLRLLFPCSCKQVFGGFSPVKFWRKGSSRNFANFSRNLPKSTCSDGSTSITKVRLFT